MKATLHFDSIADSSKAANFLVILKSIGHTFQYAYVGATILLEGLEGELGVEIVNSISTLVKPTRVKFDTDTVTKMLIDGLSERAIALLNCAASPSEAVQYFSDWLRLEGYAIENSRSFQKQESS